VTSVSEGVRGDKSLEVGESGTKAARDSFPIVPYP
jgi:hypothetical protein